MADDDQTMSRSEAGRRGGQSQSKDNPGNFANDREKASEAGKKGAKNQPTEAKREGGRHSQSS